MSIGGRKLEADEGVLEVDDAKESPEVILELERLATNGGGLYEGEPRTVRRKQSA